MSDVTSVLINEIELAKKVLRTLQKDFDRAQDNNDVNGQIKHAMLITDQTSVIEKIEESLKWYKERMK